MTLNNDLISRAELQETVECHITTVSVCATAEEARGRTAMKNICLEDIAAAPAVDAIPIVHAQWIEYEGEGRFRHWYCSNCKAVVGVAGRFGNYCLYCGAKMDGDENNAST